MIRYVYILLLMLPKFVLADDPINSQVYYFQPGPNLVSFNLLPDNALIENIFFPIQDNIIAIISSGEISYNVDNSWVGNLIEINSQDGYWVVTSNVALIDVEGAMNEFNGYYLSPGANLISYPFDNVQTLEQSIPFYMYDNLSAIIGQDEAALIYNNQIFGSLTHFEPNRGYWFILTDAIPFEYNHLIEGDIIHNLSSTNDNELLDLYNQSTLQSVFFVDEAFYNGEEITTNDNLLINCNSIIVGGRNWEGQMTDIIAMGNDGYGLTENYCENLQDISITLEKNDLFHNMYIIGNTQWENNNISIISLSNFQLGDINLDNNINITDIIIAIDHIIDNNLITNPHQLLLSDVNYDGSINITDIIFILDLIIE